MIDEVTLESFLKDVNRHKMNIIKDDGVYRHIRFKRPQSGTMYFDIITWPGNVCYTGDMGTYTFSRITDMAYFFADPDKTDELEPNFGYWAQKVQSESRFGNGIQEYSEDDFRKNVSEWFNNWKFDYLRDNLPEVYELDDNNNVYIIDKEEESPDLNDKLDLKHLQERIEKEEEELNHYLSWNDIEFESSAYQAIMTYKSDELGDEGPCFQDFFEVNCRPLTYHYQWCCYALNWGFNEYFKYLNQKRFNLKYC